MATPPHYPLPTNLPLFLGVGPSHRHTPVLIVERVVGGAPTAWNKETKPHGPPAHLSSPWTGSSCSHSPASTRPPTRGGGGGDGVLKSDSRHPSCAPSPPPRQELVTRTDQGLGGQMGALIGRQPPFLQGSGETETQGHKEKQSPG